MKSLTQRLLGSALVATFVLSFSTYAADGVHRIGGDSSGGGSYVVIDGQVQISDPYFAGVPSSQINKIVRISFFEFPKELQQYIDQIERLCLDMFVCDPAVYDTPKNRVNRFFQNTVRTSEKRYFLVPADRESNVPCERYLPTLSQNVSEHFQYGCTFGPDTYLFIDKWNRAPLDQQAFAILHERLWALNEGADQADIAKAIHLMQSFMKRFEAQTLSQDRTPVSNIEIENYAALLEVAEKLQFGSSLKSQNFRQHFTLVSGGSLTYKVCIPKIEFNNSFITLGSVIWCRADASGLKLNDSLVISSQLTFKSPNKPMQLWDSQVFDSVLFETELIKSRIVFSEVQHIRSVQSQITNSFLLDTRHVDNPQDSDRALRSEIHFSTIDKTKLVGSIIELKFQGEALRPIKLNDVTLELAHHNRFLIEAGSALSHVRSYNRWEIGGHSEIKISLNVVLNDLQIHFDNDDIQHRPEGGTDGVNGLMQIHFVKNSKLSNGLLQLTSQCFPTLQWGDKLSKAPENRFTIDSSNSPNLQDLKGGKVQIKTNRFTCKGNGP